MQENRPDLFGKYSIRRIYGDWSCMVGYAFQLEDVEFRKQTFEHACGIMSQASECVRRIIDRLESEHYRFADEANVYNPPDPDALEWITAYESLGIYLPISLQAWLVEVGRVNLMGTHPSWPTTGYVFDAMMPANDVWYTDPLVVDVTEGYIEAFYNEWKCNVEDEGEEAIGPFKIEIAPDLLHKANVSGGEPFKVDAYKRAVDAIVYNEVNCVSFTAYVRNALKWGGFPGFEYISDAPAGLIEHLRKDLLPI